MANSLSEKSHGARHAQSRTDTSIGAGVRVDGNMTFTGVLRVQGGIQGDVSCDADRSGTIVVGQSGKVTGTIRVPHVVVSGRVSGPVHSSESVEIQPGACVAGDVFYNVIDIHAGGVIEGSLTPAVSKDGDQVKPEDRSQDLKPPAINAYGMPIAHAVPAGRRLGARVGGARKLGGAVTLLIAVAVLVLTIHDPALIAPSLADAAGKAGPSEKESPDAQSAPAANDALQDSPRAVAANAVSPAPRPNAVAKSAVQAPAAKPPLKDQANVVAVQGFNASKPAGLFWAISNKAPSVLYKKKRQDPADGTRIDISEGATESIAIAKDEIFRVADGRELEIFYQGRKVAQNTIESGAWMSFVPQPPGETSDVK
jgi:cytoskeletal protein CcmA (bactofilin family)